MDKQKPVMEPCPYAVQAKAVMDALWPVLGGNQTDSDLWEDINLAVSNALSHTRPQPAPDAGGLVEQMEGWALCLAEHESQQLRAMVSPLLKQATAALTDLQAKLEEAREALERIAARRDSDPDSPQRVAKEALTRLGARHEP